MPLDYELSLLPKALPSMSYKCFFAALNKSGFLYWNVISYVHDIAKPYRSVIVIINIPTKRTIKT